jgi:hypothetical protein
MASLHKDKEVRSRENLMSVSRMLVEMPELRRTLFEL